MANSSQKILLALGYVPSFRYEKFRAEWSDGKGHVVLDETPIGFFGEIEGPARWIDQTARRLGIDRESYITDSYAELFFAWKQRTRSRANEMTFRAMRTVQNAGLALHNILHPGTSARHDFAHSPASKTTIVESVHREAGVGWIGKVCAVRRPSSSWACRASSLLLRHRLSVRSLSRESAVLPGWKTSCR